MSQKQLRVFNPITHPHLTAHRLIIGGEMHSAGVEQSNCLGWFGFMVILLLVLFGYRCQ